jgi:hypothetical protein
MSTTEVNVLDLAYQARGDLRSAQFHLVEFVADRTVQVCSATTAIACGILQNTPKSGESALVRHFGVSKVHVMSGMVGKFIAPTATGEGNSLTTPISGQYVIGMCIDGVTSGSLASVIVPAPVQHFG